MLDDLADHHDLHVDVELHDALDAGVTERLAVHLARDLGLVRHRAGNHAKAVAIAFAIEGAFFDVAEAVAEHFLDRARHVFDEWLHLHFADQGLVGEFLLEHAPHRKAKLHGVEAPAEFFVEEYRLPEGCFGAVEGVLDSSLGHVRVTGRGI